MLPGWIGLPLIGKHLETANQAQTGHCRINHFIYISQFCRTVWIRELFPIVVLKFFPLLCGNLRLFYFFLEKDVYCSVRSHYCNLGSGISQVHITTDMFGTHDVISSSVCLTGDNRNFRNGSLTISIQQLRPVTNNTAGGQPVSMQNIREVSALCKKYGVNLQIDSARFAENAYFIKTREKGYENKSIKEIVKEMFSYADIMTMSSKKDAIVNMGGFVAFKSEELWKKCQMFCIMNEGFITYGGMSGRDMNALAQGLDEGTEFEYLETRIKQVEYLGAKLDEYGIPYQRPAGGHAIFVDAKKVLTHVPKEEFIAQTLGVELYLEAGIRGVEIGSILADRDPVTRENRYPRLELLRLAIPRRTYTNNHMDVIAVALKNVYDRRESITRGYVITKEFPIMRHFTVELEKAK